MLQTVLLSTCTVLNNKYEKHQSIGRGENTIKLARSHETLSVFVCLKILWDHVVPCTTTVGITIRWWRHYNKNKAQIVNMILTLKWYTAINVFLQLVRSFLATYKNWSSNKKVLACYNNDTTDIAFISILECYTYIFEKMVYFNFRDKKLYDNVSLCLVICFERY